MHLLESAVGVLVAALLLPVLVVAARRRVLQRGGGAIELSLRRPSPVPGRGWALGVGRFEGDELRWYRMFTLGVRPRRTLQRRDLHVLHRRAPSGREALALIEGAVVMECTTAEGRVDLAMDLSAVTGFLAWLESAPPGVRRSP